MKKTTLPGIAAPLLLVLLAAPAGAGILEVTVSGVVTDSLDVDGTIFGRGAGYNTVVGLDITQVYRFDTEAPVVNYQGGVPGGNDPDAAFYLVLWTANSLACSWVSVETTIGGTPLATPVEEPRPEFTSICDGVSIADKYDAANNLFFKDQFDVSVSAVNIAESGGNRTYTSLTTHAGAEAFYDFLTDLALAQSFDLDMTREYFTGGGNLSAGVVVLDSSNTQLSQSSGNLNYMARRYTATMLAPVPVPAPALFLMSALGTLGILWRRTGG